MPFTCLVLCLLSASWGGKGFRSFLDGFGFFPMFVFMLLRPLSTPLLLVRLLMGPEDGETELLVLLFQAVREMC